MIEKKKSVEAGSEWLPLGKAAAMLGVHSMTLRRWTDNGRFPSYRTAGGHRRYAIRDIQSFLAHNQSTPETQLTVSWVNIALAHTRQEVAHHQEQHWLQVIDEQALRDEYRQMGHQLMGLLLQYIAADEPNGALLEEARRIGRRYGAYGLRTGLSLTAILEATIFFRDILIESSLQIPTTTFVEPETTLRILRRLNQVIGAVQLAVTAYYESNAQPAAGE